MNPEWITEAELQRVRELHPPTRNKTPSSFSVSGFNATTRRLIHERSGSRCERCGVAISDGVPRSVHHRRPRGMGGSKNPVTNGAVNGVYLCGSATTASSCHEWVESHRTEALALGLLVSQYRDPREVPVELWYGRVLLKDNGDVVYVA